MPYKPSRRSLLKSAALVSLGASVGASAQVKPSSAKGRPRDVGRKFYADGRVRPFAGNTIICHMPQQDTGFTIFDALLGIYRDLPGYGFTRKLALLPPSSYHMTIFGGANDQDRKPGLWPVDLPLEMPIADCDAALAARLVGFELDCELPIRMQVVESNPQDRSPILIELKPVDDGESAKLRRLRDRLSARLRIHAPDHDQYGFHITIAYLIDWFTPDEQADYLVARRKWVTALQTSAPIMTFGPPEYCTFGDMFAFRRRLLLS